MKKAFDEQLVRLEEIVSLIQDSKVGLEESMKLFEEGVKLTDDCLKFLKESKGHIEDLSEKLKSLDIDKETHDEE